MAYVEKTTVPTRAEQLEQLYAEHHSRVFRAAYRVAGNVQDAEDVLQTVFLRLWRSENALVDVDDIGNYLYRAGVNAALDRLRSQKSAGEVPLDNAPLEAATVPAVGEEDDRKQLLRRAVARLHPTAAEMFALRYFEEYSNAEVAALMGTSESTVAVTLHRTRTRLQKELLKSVEEARHESR